MESIIKLDKDFLPEHTFDCGQCFRWNKESDGSYTGVVKNKVANISYRDNNIIIKGSTPDDVSSIWEDYLDIKRDYSQIKKRIDLTDSMHEAIKFGYGIRILKQDFFEVLISFIISQRSSIPKIKSSIEKLCAAYGDKIEYSGKTYFSFPSPNRLASVTENEYKTFGVGYRAKYIETAVKSILSGEIDENHLRSLPTPEARKNLLKIYGVGNKVADCILLFSLSRFDSFPVDVWISRALKENFEGKDACALFGKDSGFAQQYLFYWKRNFDQKTHR